MSTLKNLGTKLKTLRTENNWTQQEIAQQLGISRSHYGRIERGQVQQIKKDLIGRITRFLNSFQSLGQKKWMSEMHDNLSSAMRGIAAVGDMNKSAIRVAMEAMKINGFDFHRKEDSPFFAFMESQKHIQESMGKFANSVSDTQSILNASIKVANILGEAQFQKSRDVFRKQNDLLSKISGFWQWERISVASSALQANKAVLESLNEKLSIWSPIESISKQINSDLSDVAIKTFDWVNKLDSNTFLGRHIPTFDHVASLTASALGQLGNKDVFKAFGQKPSHLQIAGFPTLTNFDTIALDTQKYLGGFSALINSIDLGFANEWQKVEKSILQNFATAFQDAILESDEPTDSGKLDEIYYQLAVLTHHVESLEGKITTSAKKDWLGRLSLLLTVCFFIYGLFSSQSTERHLAKTINETNKKTIAEIENLKKDILINLEENAPSLDSILNPAPIFHKPNDSIQSFSIIQEGNKVSILQKKSGWCLVQVIESELTVGWVKQEYLKGYK
jgi:transcriptional regulator with XRE-family HTH domain